MFKQKILQNYAAQTLDAKFEQVYTNKVSADQKQLIINQYHDMQQSWPNTMKYQ